MKLLDEFCLWCSGFYMDRGQKFELAYEWILFLFKCTHKKYMLSAPSFRLGDATYIF